MMGFGANCTAPSIRIPVREAIADRVIKVARGSSERDPERLADAVVVTLGIKL
jgi:hypothetical protein